MTTATTSYAPTNTADRVAELLIRICEGNPAAWEEIVRRYGKLVHTTVRSFRLQEADALDAVQMTWLRLVENAHQVRVHERLGGWLATTASRECLHIARQIKATSNLVDVAPETVTDPSADPEQQVINADTARIVRKLVAKLSPRRQTLVWLLFNENPRSYVEVSQTAGIPPGGVGPLGRAHCGSFAAGSTSKS